MLGEMLGTCAPSQTLTVVQAGPIETAEPTPMETGGTLPVSPTPASTYESCDDAETAGEPRVQGSSGSGRGFPAAKVPRAGDGDGDGVVCERGSVLRLLRLNSHSSGTCLPPPLKRFASTEERGPFHRFGWCCA